MRIKNSILFLLIFMVNLLLIANFPAAWGYTDKVHLRLGSWRTEDIKQMNTMLQHFNLAYPDIRIIFDPTPATEYDAVLKAQLKVGTAPDLFYLRSFGVSQQLYDAGYLLPLDPIDEIPSHFDSTMTAPWTASNGTLYGVPFIATSHGVYYNADLFEKHGVVIPKTWEDLLILCRALKRSGVPPLANASGDPWTINEIIFFNIAPNFIGGRTGRMAYLSGERCFNDQGMIDAFTALKNLQPFFVENHHLLGYMDSLQLFVQGKAAMWFGGSWDIPYFENESPPFTWKIFAPPPPKGHTPHITFHLDAGIGVNAQTRHKAAALTFIQWIAKPEVGGLMGDLLPGFFPMHRKAPQLSTPHANQFLALNQGRGTDIRLVWEKLRDGTPDGYALMLKATNAIIDGTQSPEAAADAIQAGLSQWYKPTQKCKK